MLPYEYKETVFKKAKKFFTKTPEFIIKQIEDELAMLDGESGKKINYKAGNYWRGNLLLISLLAKRVNKDAYVSDIGSNGNMLIGYLLGLSEIMPLRPFYYCLSCGHYELGPKEYLSGYSLPVKTCPLCQTKMKTLGVDIPLNENSLDSTLSVGLKVSKTFLKKNHLDIAGSFKRKMERRDQQSFALTISGAVIKFEESHEVSIIEKMVKDYGINVFDIDYNDAKAFDTIQNENKFGLSIIASGLFEKATKLVDKPLTSFDDLIRLMGFYLGPSFNINPMQAFSKNYGGVDINRLPTNREDLNKVLSNYEIDNHNACTIEEDAESKLVAFAKKADIQDELRQLIDYLKISPYFERKCAVVIKTLLVYRLAYIETYYPTEFKDVLLSLGVQQKQVTK
ncbi:MAG: hypothetical protein PHT30_01505 [Bacilli bacterium]|nr:hypothetical protein [Bacilli bacterium]